MLAISIALLIQAVFFGDGGVLTLGANCFNIAIVGCLVAAAVNRLISGHSAATSTRRVVAAGVAGYAGINIAALLTAIQFGIQPQLFHDVAGAPLYAPYPLQVAIPAMMLGHLTFAGFAEFFISAGVVSWLQRSDPGLLRGAAPTALADKPPSPRRLWAALAMLMLLTPLGLLAVGTAWGEWSPQELRSGSKRAQIAAVSEGTQLPEGVPAGLERLSSVLTAPIPDYAPPILKSTSFGYMLSAMAGSGLIVLAYLGLSSIVARRNV